MRFFEENPAIKNEMNDMNSDSENVDVDSDEDSSDNTKTSNTNNGRNSMNSQFFSQAEKRAHHNALERKRRDHIKDSFTSLRDSVPSLQGEKASRAQILKKAAEYIQFMRRKNSSHQQDIDDLKRQNLALEKQIRILETARNTGNYAVDTSEMALDNLNPDSSSSSEDGENDFDGDARRNKRMKTNAY